MIDRTEIYQERVTRYQELLTTEQKKQKITSFARLGAFLLTVALVWLAWDFGAMATMAGIAVGIGSFTFLVKKHTKLKKHIAYLEAMVKQNEDEMSAGYGGFITFEEGNMYMDHEHPYTNDLDIFGRGSLFQYINRTTTLPGRDLLASWLAQPELDIEVIKTRQKAVQELDPKLDWRQDFQTAGDPSEEKADDQAMVLEWIAEPVFFVNKWYMRAMLVALPFTMLVLIILASISIIDPNFVAAMFLLQLIVSLAFTKKIGQYHNKVKDRHLVLRKYAKLLALIESENYGSDLLKDLANSANASGTGKASEKFLKLTTIVDSFESRQNVFGAIFTNGLFLWDMQNAVRLEKWKEQFKDDLKNWFDVSAQFDALISLATLAYNRPSFNYPEPETGTFHLDAHNLGHPMLYEATRIDNDLKIGAGNFILTTGANMAGKSTFLRAVAVNLILAMTGAPVCSGTFRFVPVHIYTSMRASDSLLEHESFFYAELVKLKNIIDALDQHGQMFVLLDEILKGTNSKDQQTGSKALIEQLLRMNASGMVATHDLALGAMADTYPGKIRNMCFEIAIEDEEMVFDYKFKEGISQSLNATFLMKKMGITI